MLILELNHRDFVQLTERDTGKTICRFKLAQKELKYKAKVALELPDDVLVIRHKDETMQYS